MTNCFELLSAHRYNLRHRQKFWGFGEWRLIMFMVDNRQFEMRYAPIACGLQILVVGCVLSSILAAIWWFIKG
jgi:hypothetical protein